MERARKAPADRAGVNGVRGGDGGLGAAHLSQVMRQSMRITIHLFYYPLKYMTKTLKNLDLSI